MPEDRSDTVFLIEEIGPKPGDIGNFVAEINVAGFLEDLDLVLGGDFIEHGFERIVLQRREIDPLQFAADAQDRRIARGEVQIRGALLEH